MLERSCIREDKDGNGGLREREFELSLFFFAAPRNRSQMLLETTLFAAQPCLSCHVFSCMTAARTFTLYPFIRTRHEQENGTGGICAAL